MKLNVLKLTIGQGLPGFMRLVPRTHEGTPAAPMTNEQALRRSVMACMLWESEFYESGVTIAERVRTLVAKVPAEKVTALAVEARTKMKLRHMPLLLVREMARLPTHRALVAQTLVQVIQRADELAEFLAIYWAEGKVPLSGQVKKGLAAAFTKFDEYALAKYDRANAVRLRDVLFLCHAKPVDTAQAELWKRLIAGELATPDTWEVALSASAGIDKRAHWERLLSERKLGALALLRNLRNIAGAAVDESLVLTALDAMRTERVLPFRFLAAARYAPQWEEGLERAMFGALSSAEKLKGKTVLLVDVSGSMTWKLSAKSDMARTDAAFGLAILLREIAEKVTIYTFSTTAKLVPSRRGFALRDALATSQPNMGTNLGASLRFVMEDAGQYDRIVVITDEQSADPVPAPKGNGYMVNVACAQNGVGYGPWTHIDGWSEAVIEYIRELEMARTY